jgi:hypothetical protein
MTNTERIEALAALILEETRARLASKYSQWQADAESVEVIPGRVYTKINRGSNGSMSGMLMVENATGNIYGIKGYGQVHKGHQYGTLETVADWYWGEYYPQPASAEQIAARSEVIAKADTTPAPRSDPKFAVGDGATEHIGSDAFAYTVIKVSDSGKTITLQLDHAILSPDFKPDFTPGGFVGHVSNSDQQSYSYEPDPRGHTITARLTSKGWKANGASITAGRRAFYDYNF